MKLQPLKILNPTHPPAKQASKGMKGYKQVRSDVVATSIEGKMTWPFLGTLANCLLYVWGVHGDAEFERSLCTCSSPGIRYEGTPCSPWLKQWVLSLAHSHKDPPRRMSYLPKKE